MAKNSITDYSKTAASNTDIQSVDIAEGCLPSGINNAIREIMADLAAMNDGTVTLTSPAFAAATITGNLTVDTNTLYVDSTNNLVGIGTSSPSSIGGSSKLVVNQGADGNSVFVRGGGTRQVQLGTTSTTGYINTDNTSGLTLDVNGSERMRIDSSGNVGIGTTSPSANLGFAIGNDIKISQVAGVAHQAGNAGSIGLTISDGGNHSGIFVNNSHDGTYSDQFITFKTAEGGVSASTERMRIDSSGNVGIGTSSPNGKLHVVNQTDIAMSNSADGQFIIEGNGYSGAIALNATGMQIYQNSSARSLIFGNNETEQMRIDSSGNLGVGTSSPSATLDVVGSSQVRQQYTGASNGFQIGQFNSSGDASINNQANANLLLATNNTERMRIDSSGHIQVGKTSGSFADVGVRLLNNGQVEATVAGSDVVNINRLNNDGTLVRFFQNTVVEGSISVSGTTVSYNGGHLARWSQLTDGTKDETIVKGTVMTNLDQMAVWSHDAVQSQDAVYDEDGNVVTEAVEAKDAYTEDNEQLNCMAVSSVEGDANVAGVFVNWDNDDDEFNDMNIAMTGDMVIRIAQGATVTRGDLLMSAGDGTAKPQDDDIVRSKTIAKVTSTNVSHTYNDGSYCVPCVLMAC
jgi:hypothetical protein